MSHIVRPSKREYAEYMTEPLWEEQRKLAISMGAICQRCNTNKASQVHHLRYRDIVNIKPKDLVALCAHCHGKMHVAIRSGVKDARAVLVNDDAWLTAQLSAMRTKQVVPSEIWVRLNSADLLAQQLACGLMKLGHPNDFGEWRGKKARPSVIDELRYLSTRSKKLHRKRRGNQKRRRCI
jgi:hypothetical protein